MQIPIANLEMMRLGVGRTIFIVEMVRLLRRLYARDPWQPKIPGSVSV